MLIFKIFLFYFFNWVIKIILGFFFFSPLNDITKNFVKESQTNCCQKSLFIEKSGFHKAVSVGVAVKSKRSGKGIFFFFFLRRFFAAAGKTHALVKNYSGTHGANIGEEKTPAHSEPSHVCRAALPSPPAAAASPVLSGPPSPPAGPVCPGKAPRSSRGRFARVGALRAPLGAWGGEDGGAAGGRCAGIPAVPRHPALLGKLRSSPAVTPES